MVQQMIQRVTNLLFCLHCKLKISIPQTDGSKLVIYIFPYLCEVGSCFPDKNPWQRALIWEWFYYYPNDIELAGYSEDHNFIVRIPFTKRERV